MKNILMVAAIFCFPCMAVEQAELWMQEGLQILREKPESLIQAAGLFAKAADAYEAKKDEAKAVEANSCLYWTRKKFTVRETGIITQGNPQAAKRMEKLVAEKPKEDDAQGYLDRADAFAKDSKDPLLTAIRYFEVADRFSTTEQGRKAMDASLKAMQQVKLKDDPKSPAKAAVIPSDEKDFIGKWKTAQHGPWTIYKEADDLLLKEEGFAYTSTNTIKTADAIIFQWNAEPNLVVAFVKTGKNINVKCFRTEKFDNDVLKGKALWSMNATLVKP